MATMTSPQSTAAPFVNTSLSMNTEKINLTLDTTTLNISSPTTNPPSLSDTVFISRVQTLFTVNAVLYNLQGNGGVPWSDDYNDYLSVAYIALASQFCSTITLSLSNANPLIFQGARCAKVIFIRVPLFIRVKRQISSSTNNNSSSTDFGVQGSTTVELQTVSASQMSQTQFSELLTQGYSQLNNTVGIQLNNIETTRTSPAITCQNIQLVCGQHASCRNTENGVTCTCDPMWQDVNPSDPGKNCSLHPGTIALIVFAALLLLAAIGAIIYFVIKTKSVKKLKLKANTMN
uniref:EGF-like domain-containing protein n=1 Tax=Trichobilharzia regenti TaxID=157069 RepID=A0AA85IWU3_TRIRE|nr:unnamed protein product [Trichobilharzia regenti]